MSTEAQNNAMREVFEQALLNMAQLHEHHVSTLEGEVTLLRRQLVQLQTGKKQAILSLDGDADEEESEALNEEVALWVRTEIEPSFTAPLKIGAVSSTNGLQSVAALPALSRDPIDDSDIALKESDVDISVAMAVAAQVQADCDDEGDDNVSYVSLSSPPATAWQARPSAKSTHTHVSQITNKTISDDVERGVIDCGNEYMYRSPSEPRPEEDLYPVGSDFVDHLQNLPGYLASWVRMMHGVLRVAKEKKLYELREIWVQPDWFLAKQMRQQDNLDLFHPRNVNERRRSGSRRVTHIPEQMELLLVSTRKLNLQNLVLDPQSPKRIVWMSIGMLIMIYDLFVLPMQAFPLPQGWFLRMMQWFGQVFWTIDIFVSFMTGVYVNSELVMRPRTIARVYCSTWFVFDLLVVVPLWVVESLGIESGAGAEKSTSIFKYARMLRFLRLARLAKFEHYLQEALATVNSSALLLCFGMFKQMSCLIMFNHINACIWYAVGKHGTGGWVQKYEETPLIYRYLTSMHWAFTQFQGTSEVTPTIGEGRETLERAYAVITVMFALIILAFFVSRLTNMILQLTQLREERTGMQRAVRAYLCENNISLQLSVRVKKYIDWKQRLQTKGGSSQVMEFLPKVLQMDLLEEVRGPLITGHSLFWAMRATHIRFFRLICFEGLRPATPAPREMIFSPNETCHQMYFIVTGILRYFSSREALLAKNQAVEEALMSNETEDIVVLSNGRWLSEAVLWTHWDHRGGCMGVNDSTMLTLGSNDFAMMAKKHGPAHASGVLYARQFVAGLNRFGKNYNDILDSDALIHEMSDLRNSIQKTRSIM